MSFSLAVFQMVNILRTMKHELTKHKTVNSEGVLQQKLTKHHPNDPYTHTIYDPSLVMHALQNTLHQTSQTLTQLKKQKIHLASQPQTTQNQPPTITSKGKKKNSVLLQILLKNFAQEAIRRKYFGKEQQRGKAEGIEREGGRSGSVTGREVTLPLDNSKKNQWKKDHIKKVIESHSSLLAVMQVGTRNQGSKPLTVHRTSEKGKLCHRNFGSFDQIQNRQNQPMLQSKDHKMSSIQIKRCSIPRPEPVDCKQSLHKSKHIFNRKREFKSSPKFDETGALTTTCKCWRESESIEPWGWVKIPDEMISNWHPTI